MDFLLVLLAIIWIASSAVNKKKRQQAKEEAARRQAQEIESSPGSVPESAPAPQPWAVPVQSSKPSEALFDPYYSGSMAPSASEPPRRAAAVSQRKVAVAGSTLTEGPQASSRKALEAQVLQPVGRRHTLEASSISGHAHMESSLTGFANDCPPASSMSSAKAQPVPVQACATEGSAPFNWDVRNVTQGLVLAEILGKPKAFQNRK